MKQLIDITKLKVDWIDGTIKNEAAQSSNFEVKDVEE